MAVCYAINAGLTTASNECQIVNAFSFGDTVGPTYQFIRYPSVSQIPKFSSTAALSEQMDTAGFATDCFISWFN